MGFYRGPNIVTDGLVLALDAGNVKSFPGEPTTNLHSIYSTNPTNTTLVGVSPISTTCGGNGWSWCTYGGAYTFNYVNTLNPYGKYTDVGNLANSTNGGDYRMSIADVGATTLNRTFTFSVWVKNNGGSLTSFSVAMSTNGDSNISSKSVILTNEWQLFTFTKTFTGTCTNTLRVYFFGFNAGGNVLLYQSQLEEKPYATPFVNGTRGTTVATGGGWADKSGNSNHGELVNGPTYSGANGGSIVFDGTNDYVQSSLTGITLDSACTIEGVLKRNSTPTAWRTFFNIKPSNTNIPFFEFRSNANAEHIFVNYYNGVDNTTSSTPFPTGTLGHAVAIYDGAGNIKMYFNGELIGTKTGVPSFTIGTSPRLTIGRAYTDDRNTDIETPLIKVYNRALTAQEVLQNYNATKSRFNL